MGLLNNIFGSNANHKSLNWKILDDSLQLDQAIDISHLKPVVIFKHSTRCGISKMVLNQFENNAEFDDEKVELLFLDLLNHRNISSKIAAKFSVVHQSPQMIILKDGDVVHHSSHSAITPSTVDKFLN